MSMLVNEDNVVLRGEGTLSSRVFKTNLDSTTGTGLF